MAKTRRAYTGSSVSTTTSSNILSTGTTSFTVNAVTNWPYGSDPFYVVVEPGTASEEKILVSRTNSGDTTINVTTRGADGTSGVEHLSGSTIYPVFTAVDADEANELASMWESKGDIVSYGSSTFARLPVGSDDEVLIAGSGETSGLKWGAVDTAQLAAGAVETAKIDDGAVTTAKIANDAVTNAKIGAGAVDTTELANDAVTTAKIDASAVGTTELANGAVTNAKIGAGAVDTTELADGAVTTAKADFTTYSVTSSANYTSTSGAVYRWGNFCWVYIFAVWSGPGQLLTTLPAGARPSSRRFIHTIADGSGDLDGIYVESNGDITPVNNFTAPVNLTFTGFYTL